MRTKFTAMIAGSVLAFGTLAAATPAMAEPPGPGSSQCTPGQHGNPHPGFKAGACENGR